MGDYVGKKLKTIFYRVPWELRDAYVMQSDAVWAALAAADKLAGIAREALLQRAITSSSLAAELDEWAGRWYWARNEFVRQTPED